MTWTNANAEENENDPSTKSTMIIYESTNKDNPKEYYILGKDKEDNRVYIQLHDENNKFDGRIYELTDNEISKITKEKETEIIAKDKNNELDKNNININPNILTPVNSQTTTENKKEENTNSYGTYNGDLYAETNKPLTWSTGSEQSKSNTSNTNGQINSSDQAGTNISNTTTLTNSSKQANINTNNTNVPINSSEQASGNWTFTADSDIQNELATKLKESANEYGGAIDKMYEHITNLNDYWQGEDYTAFKTGTEGYKSALTDVKTFMEMYGDHVSKISAATEELAKNLADIIKKCSKE